MRLRKYTQDEILKDSDELIAKNAPSEENVNSSRQNYVEEKKQEFEEDNNLS